MPKLFSAVRSCRRAAALILAREDRPLGWRERGLLALHLQICEACPSFESQVDLMRQALGRWRRYREEDTPGADTTDAKESS